MMTTTNVPLQTGQTVTALNRCIEACTDGEKGYGAAAADVRSPTLKSVFRAYEQQRADFVTSLQAEIDSLGASHENQGTIRGTLHRGWTGARMQLEGRKDEVIVDECMRGEAAALRVYDKILRKSGGMPEHAHALLTLQREAVAAALEEMKNRLAFPERAQAADLGARRS